MATIKSFVEIRAWQSGRELTRRIYELTREPSLSRDHGLCDQIRRASVSIMSNIAEGFECDSNPQFLRYLVYAKGSAGEVRSQLFVALDAGYLSPDGFQELSDLADKCGRQIHRLILYLRSQPRHAVSESGAAYASGVDWSSENA